MIPQTFEQWKNYIMTDCMMNLTKELAVTRFNVYNGPGNPETQKFIVLCGTQLMRNK